jgi:hypothetical protein
MRISSRVRFDRNLQIGPCPVRAFDWKPQSSVIA